MSEDPRDTAGEATGATKREGAAEQTRTGRRATTATSEPLYLERGAQIGRYITLDTLGEGGMGVVYSAYDPELDRKVAIKLLQGQSGGSTSIGDQAWLLREAQALARLAHPNVVSVHDVGTLPGDRVFVAMELVDGVTLRRWLKPRGNLPAGFAAGAYDGPAVQRSWREILPVLVAAGQGLAAAHAAGLVHRDFKPDNVLVGNDGRVRVMDFGLAKVQPGGETEPAPRTSDLHIDTKSPLSEALTIAGTVVGTPAYMAPELYDGEAANAASDQFSFGVTLFEALFGTRPFTKEQLMPPREPGLRPRLPDATAVPARIQRTVLRAIAIDPAQRFASMHALLAELATDPLRGKRRALVAVGVLGLAGAAVAGARLLAPSRAEPCQGIEQRLAGVWDGPVKQKIHDAFAATKQPYAGKAFGQLESSLDGYATQWTTTAIESCRATRVRRDQTEEVLSLRQACLDQRLDELRALTGLLGDADPAIVDKADKIGGQLEPIKQCSNIAVLRAPGQPPPEQRAKVATLNKHIAEARANLITGRYLPTLVSSQKALDIAKEIHYGVGESEAQLLRGAALMSTGNVPDATAAYSDAMWAAIRGRRDDLAAGAAYTNAMVTAEVLGKAGEAKLLLQLGDATAERAGVAGVIELRRETVAGIVAAVSGDNAAAVAAHEKAFTASQRELGPENPALWGDEVMFATTLVKAHIYAPAAKHFDHAIALREKIVGPDHSDIAIMLSNAGPAYAHVGDKAKARHAFERALAIREKAYGKGNPLLVPTLNNFADYLKTQQEWDAATTTIERALAIASKIPGVEHPLYQRVATTQAEILGGAGKVAQARALFDELITAERRIKSETLGATLSARSELELAQQKWTDAVSFAEQAAAEFERAGGAENTELFVPLVVLAKARVALGDKLAAKPVLERAIALGTKAGMGDVELKAARDSLAALGL